MKEVEVLVSIIGTIIGLIISTVTFLLKFIKNMKGRKNAQNLLNVCDEILKFMEDAEKLLNYDGQEKKNYVVTKTKQFMMDNEIDVSFESINSKIEDLIKLTKNVNFKK